MTKQTEIRFNLKGLDKLVSEAGAYRARVGILGSNAARSDGGALNNAELGVIQMFGSITKKIPPRDFLFMPVQLHAAEITKAMSGKKVKDAISNGDIKNAYALLGAKALEYVLMAFETSGFGQWPANKASTIRRKKSDRPLIDTGQLRRAQTSDVVKKSDIQ